MWKISQRKEAHERRAETVAEMPACPPPSHHPSLTSDASSLPRHDVLAGTFYARLCANSDPSGSRTTRGRRRRHHRQDSSQDMGLVDYSDSEEEDGELYRPSAKKRRLSGDTTTTTLPPLPTNFRDLYSSTVRTSTQDDPSLHAGRKRVTPHVIGNWPAHVYLECKFEISSNS
jgi:hypothetical protein